MRLSLILTALVVLAALVVSGAADEINGESVDSSIVSVEPGTERSIFSSYKIMDYQVIDKFSPDSIHIAYALRDDAGYWYYVIAGPEGEITETAYENVHDFVFSPDEEHYAYEAYNGNKWVAVIDGSEGQEYDDVLNYIVFSHDGERYAYSAKKDGQMFMVVDGSEYGPYKAASDPIISFGGQHVLYTMVEEGNDQYVVVDGEVQELMGGSPVVSPEGSRWAYSFYSFYSGSPCYIVLDGEVIDLGKDESNRVAQMVFSPMGTRFAYVLVPGGEAYGDAIVVVDGVPGESYHDPGVGTIVFSLDESTVAYWAKAEDGGFVMVVNGEEGKIYNKIGDPVTSPDGSHVAYIVEESDGVFVVLDGIEGNKYGSIWDLTFSLDGRLAYAASDTREEGVVHLVVVDGQEDQTYRTNWHFQGIRSDLAFSPDGEHIAYLANDAGTEEFVVVDSIRYANPWGTTLKMEPQNLVWDSAEAFHYIGYNDPGIYLVTVTVPSPPQDKKVVDLGESLVKLPDESSLIQTAEWGEVPANQVIIVLAEGFGRDYADSIASSKMDGRVVGFIEYLNLYQIETSGATEADLREAISRAENDPNVEIAVPNQQGYLSISPLDDPVYADGRGIGYEIVGVKQAWDAILASGLPLAEVHVGVTDDGLYRGWGEFDNVEIDVDEKNADLPSPREGNLYEIAGSHGTGVMNIITADADDGGITGVASAILGQKLSATMINIFDEPYGNDKQVESTQDPSYPVEYVDGGKTYAIGSLVALKKEIESGSTILSCSWGTADYTKSTPAYADVYRRFFEKISSDFPGILFVCAAGNDGVSMDGSRYWPSGLNLPNMITVGNLMNDGTKCDSSNMISDNFEVTLAAPGQQSVWGRDDKGNIVNNYGGTSMATPHVTAAAAMIRSLDPSLNADEIKKILVDTARTSINLDGRQVAAPPELGGRILAIDLAVEKVIGDLGGSSTKELPPESSEEEEIFSSNNIQGVYSNPTAPTVFTIDKPLLVTFVMNYHYKNLGELPGTITLRHTDGTTYGPWQASGREGQGEVSNAYWEVRPYAIIKPGTYTILDSNPETWSQNQASGGRGMSEVRGVLYLPDSALPTEPSSEIRLLDSALSRGISQGAEETIPTDITDRFSTEDGSVFSSVKIGPVYGTHTVAWNWYSPDGSLYVDHEEAIIPETEGGDHWAWSSILIKGRDAEDMPGDWRLDVTLDGSPLLTEEFYLVEAADAGKVEGLILDLKDENSSVRKNAVDALGEIGDPRAVDPLIDALKDEDSIVRMFTVAALGEIGDPRAVDPLIEALKDESSWVRENAALALGKIGDPRAVDPLIEALKDESSWVQDTAAFALGKIGDPRAVDPLIETLKDEDGWVRGEVAIVLGDIGDTKAVGPLIEALKDEYGFVRLRAAGALGDIGDTRAVDPLIESLKDKDFMVRMRAALALGKIGDTRAIDPLIYMASKDQAESVRLMAASSLVKLGRNEYYDQVIQGLDADDSDLRGKAAEQLGLIGDTRAVDPLIDALKDEDEFVRKYAAVSLGEIGDPRAVDPLIEALEDEEEYVRDAAMEALEKIQAE